MGSHLYIKKLPFTYDEEIEGREVNSYQALRIQFTQDTEVMLSIDELKTAINWLILKHKMKYRELVGYLDECQRTLGFEDSLVSSYLGETLTESLMNICSGIGYFAKDIRVKEMPYDETIRLLREALDAYGNRGYTTEDIDELLKWVQKNFIPGEHYLYTI